MSTFGNDAWLSGFIDGEGCFTRATNRQGYFPKFTLALREDDVDVLLALKVEFGGSVGNDHAKLTGNRRPAFKWTCTGEALRRLIEYLDNFPLRARKAAQFAAWRAEWDL